VEFVTAYVLRILGEVEWRHDDLVLATKVERRSARHESGKSRAGFEKGADEWGRVQ